MKNKVKGSIFLLSGTTIWGFAFIAQSMGMELLGPFTFQFVRCMLAVGFLIPAAFLFDGKNCGFSRSIAKWTDKKLWKTGICCGLALFAAASLQQIGILYTTAGKAAFITAMYIVLVPILGMFFKQKPPKTTYFSVILAVIGLYLLSAVDSGGVNAGDICLTASALAFAVQIVCIDRLAGDLDGVRLNCIQCFVVAVLSVPFMAATENVVIGNIWACRLPLLFAGVLSMGVAYTLQILGQKHLEPTAASLIMSLESVFAAVGGWLVLHETMSSAETVGSGLVFSAVILSQIPKKEAEEFRAERV